VEVLWEHEEEEGRRKILSTLVDTNKLRGKEVSTCITVDDGILRRRHS